MKEKKKGAQGKLVEFINKDLKVQASVRAEEPGQTVILYRLEETTTEEEVKKSLMTELRCSEDRLRVEKIRVTEIDGVKTSSVLVKMNRSEANRILKAGACKIGWRYCAVRPWYSPPVCYKCQEVGHRSFECKSETAIARKCYRCDEEGHISKDCTKDAAELKCRKCGNEGRSPYTTACPAFRSLLAQAKQAAKEKKAPKKQPETKTTEQDTMETDTEAEKEPTPAKESTSTAEMSGQWVKVQGKKKTISDCDD